MTRGHGPSIMVYIGPDSYDLIPRFFLADFPTELNQTMAKSFGTRARALSTFILSQLSTTSLLFSFRDRRSSRTEWSLLFNCRKG